MQSFTYDQLGNVTNLTYPWHDSVNTTVPRRRVDFRFEDGRLTSVLPYYATDIAYHYNGLIHRVTTGKRVVELEAGPRWEQAIDPATAMARPKNIGTVGVTLSGTGGVGEWSTDTYLYDGAGNITAVGAETYTYDLWATSPS